MDKCKGSEFKKCAKLIKKCNKKEAKNCNCAGEEAKKGQDPALFKEDILWAYFSFKMINELLGDKKMRDKLKDVKTGKDPAAEPNAAFDMNMLSQVLEIGPISGKEGTTSAPGKPAPQTPK